LRRPDFRLSIDRPAAAPARITTWAMLFLLIAAACSIVQRICKCIGGAKKR
jgi:hypothetical protein